MCSAAWKIWSDIYRSSYVICLGCSMALDQFLVRIVLAHMLVSFADVHVHGSENIRVQGAYE